MLENCRLVLYMSRFYGCHPHTIGVRPGPMYFGLLVVYSLIAWAVFCTIMYFSDGVSPCDPVGPMVFGCFLQQVYRYSRCVNMILTPLLSLLRHADFENAVTAAEEFDELVGWRVNGRANKTAQLLAVFCCHVCWILTCVYGWYAANHKISTTTFIFQNIVRIAFTVQVAKLCFLFDALRVRFRRLNELCDQLSDEASPSDQRIVHSFTKRRSQPSSLNGRPRRVTVGAKAERLTISRLQRMHRRLRDATSCLNTYFSPQLFCWITSLVIDILVNIFLIIYKVNSTYMVAFQIILVTYMYVIIFVISRVCHLTCDQANALARTIFSVEAFVLRRREISVEAIELGVYLQTHPLNIKVLSLFTVDSRLSLTIFSLVLMYVITSSSIH